MKANKKIKVFLGGRINDTQAQNLTSRALAKFFDKDRFEVGVMTVFSGDIPDEKWPGVKYFPVKRPARIWDVVRHLQGILWCDVAFLTAGMKGWRMHRFLCKLLRKPAFQTVEGVYSDLAKERAIANMGSIEEIVRALTWTGRTYSITHAMVEKNKKEIGLDVPDQVLYLGVDSKGFEDLSPKEKLADVVMIGADLKRKRVGDYLALSRKFPQLTFHIVGGNIGAEDYKAQIAAEGGSNIVFHGPLSRAKMFDVVRKTQLHIFPSRDEGFPKVTLDCAAAGVPSLVYDDYGADEWIEHGKSGFVVKTLEDMYVVVQRLIDEPGLLQRVSDGARAMAKRFDWSVIVRDWEQTVEKIYREWCA